MLRENQCIIPYPSKTVVEDLCGRSEAATSSDFTPFKGKFNDVIVPQFPGKLWEKYSERDLINYYKDNDFNPARRTIYKKIGELETDEAEQTRYVLEDFMDNGTENPDIEIWFTQFVIGYKKHDASKFTHDIQTYGNYAQYSGDEDSYVDIRELEEDETAHKIDASVYQDAVDQLPFYIKAIWEYCLKYRANLFTFIKAYAEISAKYGSKNIQPKYFDSFDYLVKLGVTSNKYGEKVRCFKPGREFNDMKDPSYTNARDLFINPNVDPGFTYLLNKFIQICDTLKIDLRKQDMGKLDKAFISKLVCTYIPPTYEFTKFYGDVDSDVIMALSEENIGNPKLDLYTSGLFSRTNKINSENADDAFKRRVYMEGLAEDMFIEKIEEYAINLYEQYQIYGGFDASPFLGSLEIGKAVVRRYFEIIVDVEATDANGNPLPSETIVKNINQRIDGVMSKISFDNFFVSCDGDVLRFDSDVFKSGISEVYTKCYITNNGAVIAATSNMDNIYIVKPSDAINYLNDLFMKGNYKDAYQTKCKWSRLQ